MSIPTPSTSHRARAGIGPLQIAIWLLAALTALVHLALGVITTALVTGDPTQAATLGGTTSLSIFASLFYLSFVGYVVLTVALYLPALHPWRRLVRWALVGWTAGNIVAYFVFASGSIDAFGIVDKVCEILLIALLVIEGRRLAGSSDAK
jgi:hypothetical protein